MTLKNGLVAPVFTLCPCLQAQHSLPSPHCGFAFQTGNAPGAISVGYAGIKVYIAGSTKPYVVYGGNYVPSSMDEAFLIAAQPETYGYQFLGGGSSTKTFSAKDPVDSYAYYLVKPETVGPIRIDAFNLVETSQFWMGMTYSGLGWYTSNFSNSPCDQFPPPSGPPTNTFGPPDGKYSCLVSFDLMPGGEWAP